MKLINKKKQLKQAMKKIKLFSPKRKDSIWINIIKLTKNNSYLKILFKKIQWNKENLRNRIEK